MLCKRIKQIFTRDIDKRECRRHLSKFADETVVKSESVKGLSRYDNDWLLRRKIPTLCDLMISLFKLLLLPLELGPEQCYSTRRCCHNSFHILDLSRHNFLHDIFADRQTLQMYASRSK